MENTPTPHNSAKYGDFAKTVIMPGDPLRSKLIAETYLTKAVLVNNVRGIQGYTGTYKGTKVSVMASGMGMPAMGIYSYELFNFYGVENIIRVGSAGACQDDMNLKDLVIANHTLSDSNYNKLYTKFGHEYTLDASKKLVDMAKSIADDLHYTSHTGTIISSDTFYGAPDEFQVARKNGMLAIEMEGSALYANAIDSKKNALVICTVSDCPLKGLKISSEERQTGFSNMMKLALEMAVKLDK